MKKSALVIVIMLTVVACLSLTACNSSTPQGQLGNYFAPYEKFVYDVAHTTEEGVISGKYTIEIEQFDGGDITVGDVLVKNNRRDTSSIPTLILTERKSKALVFCQRVVKQLLRPKVKFSQGDR